MEIQESAILASSSIQKVSKVKPAGKQTINRVDLKGFFYGPLLLVETSSSANGKVHVLTEWILDSGRCLSYRTVSKHKVQRSTQAISFQVDLIQIHFNDFCSGLDTNGFGNQFRIQQ